MEKWKLSILLSSLFLLFCGLVNLHDAFASTNYFNHSGTTNETLVFSAGTTNASHGIYTYIFASTSANSPSLGNMLNGTSGTSFASKTLDYLGAAGTSTLTTGNAYSIVIFFSTTDITTANSLCGNGKVLSQCLANIGVSTSSPIQPTTGPDAYLNAYTTFTLDEQEDTTTLLNLTGPSPANYLAPFTTYISIEASTTAIGTLQLRTNTATQSNILLHDFGNVYSGTYVIPQTFSSGSYEIYATFKKTGFATSTSQTHFFTVGGYNTYSTSTGPFSDTTTRESFCDTFGSSTITVSAFSISLPNIAWQACSFGLWFFVPGQLAMPQLEIRTKAPFAIGYRIADGLLIYRDTPTTTVSFGIDIPTLTPHVSSTWFAFTADGLATGNASSMIRAMQPVVAFTLWCMMIIYACAIGLGLIVGFLHL